MKTMRFWVSLAMAGYLVGSSLQILPSPNGQVVSSVCRYSDGVVLQVPGTACPASD